MPSVHDNKAANYRANGISKLTIAISVVVIIIVILAFTNPTRTDFYTWLESEYGIHVSYDINETTYTQITNGQERSLNFRSGHIQHVGIFTTYNETFMDAEGNEINIKAIGVMNMFFER
ncbi:MULTISPECIES: hypothetical protein [unclassified Paenibacillus]|uniref:hypothetical protein n=1 Tax=unclassified Paenibacillus TaxID=185978 RepID=UPI0009A872A6|nr:MULTISPECIES: hypothetical protein [unclassified Paenibacillus]SLK13211.1 hypothetical protein SAMN06272722_108101 [Paenibacillus sp. RU5A]SOC72952.1 hypothetical protein SAMN05880581_108101 [Paenibacillus sp. RU26A]SOC75208.1 hypothetical protein SAMN05880586_108101 [Paenibacillus sp. RU5M]